MPEVMPMPMGATVRLDARKVRTALDRKGLTQPELAGMAAVDENTVSRAVRGLPIRRHKAALIMTSLLKVQDVAGMEEFLPCA
jgi:ribosome-binding protein aMBF1 (putative translation factor)